jgi:hypothetical protein
MQDHYKSGYWGVKPDTISFSSVINAWAASGDPVAPQRAEALLKRMQKMHEAGNHDVKPNTITINSIISAWAQSGDYDAGSCANQHLTCTKNVEALGQKECGPDEITYNFVIKAWSNSRHPHADRETSYSLTKGDEEFGSNRLQCSEVIFVSPCHHSLFGPTWQVILTKICFEMNGHTTFDVVPVTILLLISLQVKDYLN